jgi:peptide/nickel transport system substrate-binding protein
VVQADSSTRANALRAGDVDMLEATNADLFEEFDGDDDYRIYQDEAGETTEAIASLNAGRLPFEDIKARQAIAYAIDRDAVSSQLYLDRFPPANDGPFKESSPWNQGVEFPTYDPERAQELAAEYQEEHGEPIKFSVQIQADPNLAKIAQFLQAQLAALDIEMEIETLDATTGIVNAATGNYDMGIATILWGSQNPDREYFVLHSSNAAPMGEVGTNITRTRSDELDAALDAARATSDMDEQIAAWKDAQEVLAEYNSSIFLVHLDVGEVASTRVQAVQDWTFPDGTPGRPQEQTVLSLYQIWLQQ